MKGSVKSLVKGVHWGVESLARGSTGHIRLKNAGYERQPQGFQLGQGFNDSILVPKVDILVSNSTNPFKSRSIQAPRALHVIKVIDLGVVERIGDAQNGHARVLAAVVGGERLAALRRWMVEASRRRRTAQLPTRRVERVDAVGGQRARQQRHRAQPRRAVAAEVVDALAARLPFHARRLVV